MVVKKSLGLLEIRLGTQKLSYRFVLLLVLNSITKKAILSLGLILRLKLLSLRLNGVLRTGFSTSNKEICDSLLVGILRLISCSLSYILLLRQTKTTWSKLLSHWLVAYRRLLSLVSSEKIGRLSSWLTGLLISIRLLLALKETLLSRLIALLIIPTTLVPRCILLILSLIISTKPRSIKITFINTRLEILLVLSGLSQSWLLSETLWILLRLIETLISLTKSLIITIGIILNSLSITTLKSTNGLLISSLNITLGKSTLLVGSSIKETISLACRLDLTISNLSEATLLKPCIIRNRVGFLIIRTRLSLYISIQISFVHLATIIKILLKKSRRI